MLERAIYLGQHEKQSSELEPLFQSAAANPVIARALSHPMRVATLLHLMHRGGEETDETELAESLGLSPSTMKYHLTVLRDSGLITCVENGATERYIAAAATA